MGGEISHGRWHSAIGRSKEQETQSDLETESYYMPEMAGAFDRTLDLIPARAHDHHLPLRRQLRRARQQMQQHRPPGDRVQHLVQR